MKLSWLMITLITKKVSIDAFRGTTNLVWTLFVDENFVNDEQNVCMETWLFPVFWVKQLLLLALSSKPILCFKLYATGLLKLFN